MEGNTVSINGGPEVTMDALKKGIEIMEKAAIQRDFPALQEFFAEVDRREEEISEVRTEINECFDSYCSSTGTNKDALKLAYKLFKAINKDKTKAEVMQFEYDKMAGLLLPEDDGGYKQQSLL
jgi:uncharacterized protein (UPF0335 family)